MVEKILNNTTPYGKIRASHEGSLHSSTLNDYFVLPIEQWIKHQSMPGNRRFSNSQFPCSSPFKYVPYDINPNRSGNTLTFCEFPCETK